MPSMKSTEEARADVARKGSLYSDIDEIKITDNLVSEELVKTIRYSDIHFQVVDCSGRTGNRLNVKIIPFNSRRTYVEINDVLVMDLAKLQQVAAVLPSHECNQDTIEIILDDGSPIVLKRCTPAMFAEAISQLGNHFATQLVQARNEISSVIDCYAFETPVASMTRGAQKGLQQATATGRNPPKVSLWRRLRK